MQTILFRGTRESDHNDFLRYLHTGVHRYYNNGWLTFFLLLFVYYFFFYDKSKIPLGKPVRIVIGFLVHTTYLYANHDVSATVITDTCYSF